MRYILTLLIGGVAGYAVALWTPASNYINRDYAQQLFASFTNGNGTAEFGDESDQSPETIESAARFAKVGSDILEQKNVTIVSNPMGASQDQSLVNRLTPDLGFLIAAITEETESEDLSAEIEVFEQVQAALVAENEILESVIPTVDTSHPQHHLLKCVVTSNNSLYALYDFFIYVAGVQGELDPSKIDELEATFLEHQTNIGGIASTGQMIAKSQSLRYRVMPAKSDIDRQAKALVLEMFESYEFAFDVETALAQHNVNFIDLFGPAVPVSEVEVQFDIWMSAFGQLAQARLDSQGQRDRIASDLMALAETS